MNNIQPKYVNFEQAKWLKEIGFDEYCNECFYKNEESEAKYHTTEEFKDICYRPEQWVVVEWLLVNKGIYVEAPFWDEKFRIKIVNINTLEVLRGIDFDGYNSPQEAYSAAFDYIKENNLI